MNEKELLLKFLSVSPESTHMKDRERFVRYALECLRNNHEVDWGSLQSTGLSDEIIEDYQVAFDWIKISFRILNE